MGDWKTMESPRLRVPFEFREVTAAGARVRVWEVQELRKGSMFKVTVPARAAASDLAPLERAVCEAVEDALLEPPDKEPGETYDVVLPDQALPASARPR